MSQTIYEVKASDLDRYVHIAFATGHPEDIKAYFADKQIYTLEVEPISIVHITPESAREKASLLEEKKRIEGRLAEINKVLK